METTKQTLKLTVPFTVERELEMHREIAEKLADIHAIEEQKKRIAGLKARIEELRLGIDAKIAEEDVEVEDFEDVETGLIKRRRVDTGEFLSSRPMDPEERQLRLGGVSDELKAKLSDLNKTEEQVVASTPEEAEEIRNQRLLQEQRDRDAEPPKRPALGDDIEVFSVGVWIAAKVSAESSTSFAVKLDDDDLEYDFDEHGTAWRWPTTWSDAIEASAEKERLAEIERLAGEQAADAAKSPKALLKAPRGHKAKKNGAPKRISVADQDDKPIPPAEPTVPEIGCFEDYTEEHEHREPRVAF